MEPEGKRLRNRPLLIGGGAVALVLAVGAGIWVIKSRDQSAQQDPVLEGYDLVMSEAQANGGRMMLMKAKDGKSTAVVFISQGTAIGPGFQNPFNQVEPGLDQGEASTSPSTSQSDEELYGDIDAPQAETGLPPADF